MNILTMDGDRYILTLPTPEIMRQLRTDLFGRGYADWPVCVVKAIRANSFFQKKSTVTALESDMADPDKLYEMYSERLNLQHVFCITTPLLSFRPMLIPLNRNGQRDTDIPLNPNWLETEGGAAYINGKLVDFDQFSPADYSLYDGHLGKPMVHRLSLGGSRRPNNNIRWVWMDGCMVSVNFSVMVPIEFIREAKYLH